MYAHIQKSTSVFTYKKCTGKEKRNKQTNKQTNKKKDIYALDQIIHSFT